jgi:hypothetical protein
MDKRRWPDVVVTMVAAPPNEAAVDNFIVSWKRLYEREQRFSITVDVSQMSEGIPMPYIMKMVAMLRECEPLSRRLISTVTVRLSSPIVAGIVAFIMKLRPPVRPIRVETVDASGTVVSARDYSARDD